MKIYCKFTVESVYERILKSRQHLANLQARKLTVHVQCAPGHCTAERWQLARDLEYGKKQLLLSVVTSILTWLRELSKWCRPTVTCQLTPSETVIECWWCAKGFFCKAFFLCCRSCVQSLFCGLLDKYLLLSKVINAHIIRQVFFSITIFSRWILHGSLCLAW